MRFMFEGDLLLLRLFCSEKLGKNEVDKSKLEKKSNFQLIYYKNSAKHCLLFLFFHTKIPPNRLAN
jgi:hypothetical protein